MYIHTSYCSKWQKCKRNSRICSYVFTQRQTATDIVHTYVNTFDFYSSEFEQIHLRLLRGQVQKEKNSWVAKNVLAQFFISVRTIAIRFRGLSILFLRDVV